ncbi:DUF1684 domain-containing protein [Flagellimonas sp. S3867]|uniref:DUF1684 domain-containing protein n=1 Tax=Flagellimonas sp. S3867 TaxID=2768063 RepID=UPI0016829494|nr:DUF1684 domain-containing protein [Flagellimonas sp. S3867]
MRLLVFVSFLFSMNLSIGQTYQDSVIEFQNELNTFYGDEEKSPLTKKDFKKFKGHYFFDIDENFKVEAKFDRAVDAVPFLMKTSTDRLPTYEIYGVATFKINGKTHKLNIYQNHKLRETEKYKNHLFLPFTDLTNGNETYGGGRFIDLEIPDGDTIVIDFNKAYNPYCAYNKNYSCPIPPKENDLPIRIIAGIKNK